MFYKRAVRDGTNMFINHKNLPNACKIQTRPNDPISREQIKENLQVPRERRHIVLGLVMNKTVLFDVIKGVDICIVYDTIECLLSAALW